METSPSTILAFGVCSQRRFITVKNVDFPLPEGIDATVDKKNVIKLTGIDKEYPKSMYDMQFALYIDKIVARIDLQTEAYSKEENLPGQLFEVFEAQKAELLALKEAKGAVVDVETLVEIRMQDG